MISIVIINEKLENKLYKITSQIGMKGIYKTNCHGMGKGIFDFINVNKNDKSIYFFSSSDDDAERLRKAIGVSRMFSRHNSGIVFTLKGDFVDMKKEVVVTIVNYGHGSTVMQIAREMGVSGGTIFDARGTGTNTGTFFGSLIGSEKEVVLNVVDAELAELLTKALKEKFSDANASGISFSLPIDNFLGINNK